MRGSAGKRPSAPITTTYPWNASVTVKSGPQEGRDAGGTWAGGGAARFDGQFQFSCRGTSNEAALCSSAHGAGRALSRTAAHVKVTERDLRRQMDGVWFDYRLAERLRDEAPSRYKDIKAVLRAQRDLVKVTRVLRLMLNYKGV